MAFRMPFETAPIVDYFATIGVEGMGIYVYDRAVRELKKQPWMYEFIRSTKQYFEAAMDVLISVLVYFSLRYTVGDQLPVIVYRAIRAGGSYGVYQAFGVTIKDIPKVVITDAQTIEVFNLDGTKPVEVWIDGSKVQFSTPPTTNSDGYAKITLPSALSEGVHSILVHTGFKAAFTDQYVKSSTSTSSATGVSR